MMTTSRALLVQKGKQESLEYLHGLGLGLGLGLGVGIAFTNGKYHDWPGA